MPPVLQVLGVVVPLGLAGALSPVMLTEQTVLLAGPGGRRAAGRYATGAALVLLAFVGVLVLFGRSIALPLEPHLDATLDLVLGTLLVALAALLRRGRPREPRRRPPGGAIGPRAALAFGVAAMATNVTTLAPVVPAAKEIAAGDLGLPGRAAAVVVLVGLASAPAWVPVALTAVAPGPAERALRAVAGLIRRRGRRLAVWLLAALGVLLDLRGLLRLLGG
jgi:hypothetical protein